MKLEQVPLGVIVEGRCETGFQGLQHRRPRGKEPIPMHPLIPRKGRAVHIERSDGEAFKLRDTLIIKELRYFKYPAEWVMAVEPGNIELEVMVARGRGRRNVGRGVGGRGIVGLQGDGSKTIKEGFDLGSEG